MSSPLPKPLTYSEKIQVRLTKEQYDFVMVKGGSEWVRALVESDRDLIQTLEALDINKLHPLTQAEKDYALGLEPSGSGNYEQFLRVLSIGELPKDSGPHMLTGGIPIPDSTEALAKVAQGQKALDILARIKQIQEIADPEEADPKIRWQELGHDLLLKEIQALIIGSGL